MRGSFSSFFFLSPHKLQNAVRLLVTLGGSFAARIRLHSERSALAICFVRVLQSGFKSHNAEGMIAATRFSLLYSLFEHSLPAALKVARPLNRVCSFLARAAASPKPKREQSAVTMFTANEGCRLHSPCLVWKHKQHHHYTEEPSLSVG